MTAAGQRTALFFATLVVTASVVAPAGAVFPGRNGGILVSTTRDTVSEEEYGATWLAALSERPTRLRLPYAPFFPFIPAISADGERVAYRLGRGISFYRVDGSRRSRLLTRGHDSDPAWSPRGGALAFVRTAF